MGKPLCTLLTVAAFAASGCEMRMPKMEMPDLLREEKPEVRLQRHVAAAVADDDDIRFLRAAADALETARTAGWDRRRLLVEMLACRARLSGEEQTIRFGRLLETMRFPRSVIVDIAATRLESSDAATAAAARALLRQAAPPDPRGRVDFTHFGQYLDAHLSSPPAGLIAWMYETDASAAMWQMMAVFGAGVSPEQRKAILLAERAVADAVWRMQNGAARGDAAASEAGRALGTLAGSEYWWVRAWAAYIAARHPNLRGDVAVDRLRNDESPIVRALAP